MDEFPVLETERLLLREFQASDALAVFDIFSRDEVTRYTNPETMHSVAPAARLVEVRAASFGKKLGIRWAITFKGQPERAIGSCGCYNLNKAFRSIEIGYDLHPDHWRRGIMTEALTAMLDFCFGDRFFFRTNRVEALTDLGNVASRGLLEKLGFVEEGIRREYGYWKDRFHDVRAFALLRRDWRR